MNTDTTAGMYVDRNNALARRIAPGALMLVLALPVLAARNAPNTVGQVAESNGLTSKGWFRVQTPSILRLEVGDHVQGDARSAIAQYDLLLRLDPAAIEPRARAEALRRASDLRVQLADQDHASGHGFHVSDVRHAIADYHRLLQEHPDASHNDRALYQLARAHELLREDEPAIQALLQLAQRHPQSERAADGGFRAGEMLFVRKRHREAEGAYAGVLALGPDTRYHDLAQYKYGWTLYQQSQFEGAARVFLSILDRDLPAGELDDAQAALATVEPARSDRAAESLRVAALSFAALGGGEALSAYLAAHPADDGVRRMRAMLFARLGDTLLEQERYTEAAGAYLALIGQQPDHRRAPDFQARAITAYHQGGFGELALDARAGYAERYAPGSAYWTHHDPDPAVLAEVRRHHDALGRHHQANAQNTHDPAARRDGYLRAAQWYRKTLDRFPEDPATPATSLLLADALLEGGRIDEAALQYEHTAYVLPTHGQAPAAALAAVQTWQRQVRDTQGPTRETAQRKAIASGLRLAEAFPDHPQRGRVLMAAAEDRFALGELDLAVATAGLALDADPSPDLRRDGLNLIADARFARGQYAEAERAYVELMQIRGISPGPRARVVEQLAASVYKQGETARQAGELEQAAEHFERVARRAPTSSLRASADYDAAMVRLELEDWPRAAASLEQFRRDHLNHHLLPDADKKLALAYENSARPAQAAAVYQRIALRDGEAPEIRRLAAWSAAGLYQQAGLGAQTLQAYQAYLRRYPQPLEAAMLARLHLAELSLSEQRDAAAHRYWLQQIVQADSGPGAHSEDTRRRIARASLDLGRLQAADAARVPLQAPLELSLARRKAAIEAAVGTLERAAAHGYAEITSAATYELASVYADFGRALMQSERPTQLQGDALEQYAILLEEQAFPFEEKAIRAHEINLSRLRQGIWNDAIDASVAALGELSPAKYGKQEQREATYDELD